MRRHLILFVRAPALGRGKRRLAREIGDVAALRFERLMIARLPRRLAGDARWRLRLVVTPNWSCHEARSWRHGITSCRKEAAISAAVCAAPLRRPRPARWF